MAKTGNVFRIRTSGWSYPAKAEGSWTGILYPPGMVDELSYYGQKFNTVEINSTFYGPPAGGYAWNWALLPGALQGEFPQDEPPPRTAYVAG